jgi:hypothetical protein
LSILQEAIKSALQKASAILALSGEDKITAIQEVLKQSSILGKIVADRLEIVKLQMRITEPPAPPSPEEVIKEKRELQNLTEKYFIDLANQSGVLGLIPWFDFDRWLTSYSQAPSVRARLQIVENLFMAAYNYGQEPLIKRYYSRLYQPYLPPYQDIISIYMKEGYMPEKWVEIPEEFICYLKELGYSPEWAKRLWGKHWVLPSVDLLYEMFWKKIISYDDMVKMLKYHDFEPVWRERLIQNAYRAIPRVDLRRAYRYGITDITSLTERYEWLGFKPEDAAKMASIAVRESLEHYYTRLEQVARQAYRKGLLDREGFTAILRQINTPEPAIALALEAEDLARAAKVREPAEEPPTLTVSQILSLYGSRKVSREFASERLRILGYSSEDISLLLSLYEPKPEPAEVNRELVSAASQLYREGFMGKDEFAAYLRKAGLSEREIEIKIEAEDLRYRYDYLKDLVALAKEAYKKDVYTSEELEGYLLYYGMQFERVKAISALEQLRKMPKPKEAA